MADAAGRERVAQPPARGGCWRLAERGILALSLTLVVAVLCAILCSPQLEGVVTGSVFGPTSPQSPFTVVYAQLAVDGVHVTRSHDAFEIMEPFDRSGSGASVQALYNTAFAQPPYPTGTINCPADTDITFHLLFTEHSVPVLTMIANGCFMLDLVGLGARAWGESFDAALATALGVSEDSLWSYQAQ